MPVHSAGMPTLTQEEVDAAIKARRRQGAAGNGRNRRGPSTTGTIDPKSPALSLADISSPKPHPSITWQNRLALVGIAQNAGLPALQRSLRNLGYESRPSQKVEGTVDIRRTGELRWHPLDPSSAEWHDIADIAPDVVRTVAAIGGFAGGATLSTPGGPPGMLAGGTGGAMAGSALTEGALAYLSNQFGGTDIRAGEAGMAAGKEAILSGGASLGGAAVGKLAKAGISKLASTAPVRKFLPKSRIEVGEALET